MKILLVSPLGFAVNDRTKYAGIEKLVYSYARELVHQGHSVTVMGHRDSVFPEAVTLLSCEPDPDFIQVEVKAFQRWQYELRNHDVIHDFSHQHLASKFLPNLPSLNIFWHAPETKRYPKAKYNIIALSEWARKQFRRYYHQKALYQQSIAIDVNLYKPKGLRGDKFLTIGRMADEKGNMEAIYLCLQARVSLDVAGGRGAEHSDDPLTKYEQEILRSCDGDQIRFLGEVTEEEKIELMQTCRGLIYATDHPEVTSHKIQECLFCGAPVIVPKVGAIPEIVTDGVDGFLCFTEDEYIDAIKNIGQLDPSKTRDALVEKYSVESVVRNYIPLYEEVKGGLRW